MLRSVKYSRETRLALSTVFGLVWLSVLSAAEYHAAPKGERVSAGAVIREVNLARQNPSLYATYIGELCSRFDGISVAFPGEAKWRMKEGMAGIKEAVRFLRTIRAERPLALSPGMCRAAADQCADQVAGRTGHRGSDRSSPGYRLRRYGIWTGFWGENIAYGRKTPRAIIVALIIDDGCPARTHRKNIFDPSFNYAGAAYGPHALHGSVCTIDFASGYTEGPAHALIGRTF
jgi:uncharacterized protein YkwD